MKRIIPPTPPGGLSDFKITGVTGAFGSVTVNDPSVALYGIRVIKQEVEDDSEAVEWYEASVVGEHDWLKGIGDTPEEAFYDLCEIIAEWGLDGERRNYPPSWWQLAKYRLEDWAHGIMRWFE